jgi:hypothetical protein
MQGEDDVFARREAEMAPQRQRYSAMADTAMLERHQAYEKLKDKRIEEGPAPKQNDSRADSDWLTAATMIGALAGAFTRNHTTNALAAFTGAMQGYQQGSQQKFENNMKTWEAERKRAIDAHTQAQDEYRSILENRKLDMEQMSIELRMTAEKYQDQAMATAARTKNSLVIAQLYDQSAKYLEQAKTSHDRLSQQWDLAQQKMLIQHARSELGGLHIDPDKLDSVIDAIGQYRMAAPPALKGFALKQLVTAKYPDYDETLFARKRSAAVREGGTMGSASANVELVLSRAGPVIENAVSAANAVPATEFKRINQLYQMAAEEISDPAVKNFKLSTEELAMLFAAVMNPRSNVITVSAAEHARALIATADGPDAYQSLLENIARLANRERDITRGLREGKPVPDVVVPPVSETRRSTAPAMMEKTAGAANKAIDEALPGAQEAWERAHPHLPDWVPRLPEGWYSRIFQ